MRNLVFVIGVLLGAAAGCSIESSQKAGQEGGSDEYSRALTSYRSAAVPNRSNVANYPDRGELLAYTGGATPVERGGSRWFPVNLSEDHALRAVATGTLTVTTPEGRPLRFEYKRHVEHKDGNWTWVGRMEGAEGGREAVLTFGEEAVFGSIPYDDDPPLKLAMSGGRTWLVQSDPRSVADDEAAAAEDADFVIPDVALAGQAGAMKTLAMAPAIAYSHVGTHATVDIALGYTSGMAAGLGGQSQAVTRLTHLVDLTNQAFAASGVDCELRLVSTVMVDYPDATSNRTALFELTGVECTSGVGASLPGGSLDCTWVGQPQALRPLIEARENVGADVVSLVRSFDGANGSCGIGWMLGGGQQEITAVDAAYAMSIVSDTSAAGSCRDETLAHEVGHNLGLQHDRESAQGSDDTDNDGNLLDPSEFGRYPYSFGHSTGAGAGNFYTIMALRRAGQVGYLLFSNPNLASCGGQPCGVIDQADNARSLNQTMAVVAGFRQSGSSHVGRVVSDMDGDARSDILWHNGVEGRFGYWLMAGASVSDVINIPVTVGYRVPARGDFDGDGRTDILWTSSARDLWLWSNGRSGTFASSRLGSYSANWAVVGAGDINADGKDDVLWHNAVEGRFGYWLMDGSTVVDAPNIPVTVGYRIASTGDFNGDGYLDVFWTSDRGDLWLWSGSAGGQFASNFMGSYEGGWAVAGAGDIDANGTEDLLWHNDSTGRFGFWILDGASILQWVELAVTSGYRIASSGDYNGDGKLDLIWTSDKLDLWLWTGSGSSEFTSNFLGYYGGGWQVVGPDSR